MAIPKKVRGRPRKHDDKAQEVLRLIYEGWSERQVAAMTGVSKSAVHRIVSGKT